jgi:sugar O-acyltransferase (sialic acid O-acetyltransferase NeuD family)
MKKEEIILIGGGGHCSACIDVIESENRFLISGIVDIREKMHQKVSGYEIIACDDDLPRLAMEYKHLLITMGAIANLIRRAAMYDVVKKAGGHFPVIVSPHAYISKHAVIDEGTIVMHRAVINSNARIGKNCIINTGALVEHDITVGDHCHISTSSVVNGGCKVGERVFIGSGSIVIQGITVADDVLVGAGAVVNRDVDEKGVYIGNPVRRLR